MRRLEFYLIYISKSRCEYVEMKPFNFNTSLLESFPLRMDVGITVEPEIVQ